LRCDTAKAFCRGPSRNIFNVKVLPSYGSDR
jgi:hypothetical protein